MRSIEARHERQRKIYYYRCLGSDAYRHAGKAIGDQKPIRQDLLDQLVWTEILRLLEDPTLIQNELNRRLEAARDSNPIQSNPTPAGNAEPRFDSGA